MLGSTHRIYFNENLFSWQGEQGLEGRRGKPGDQGQKGEPGAVIGPDGSLIFDGIKGTQGADGAKVLIAYLKIHSCLLNYINLSFVKYLAVSVLCCNPMLKYLI